MSEGSYQPFDLSDWRPQSEPKPVSAGHLSPVASAVAESVASRGGFADWGKGEDFRRFQRDRANGVAAVAAVATPALPWADGLVQLQRLPCPIWLDPDGWENLVYQAVTLSRDWGRQAHALGWSEIDLFGCHRQPWARRIDLDGLAVRLATWHGPIKVAAMSESSIALTVAHDHQLHFRHHERHGSVPLWIGYAHKGGP